MVVDIINLVGLIPVIPRKNDPQQLYYQVDDDLLIRLAEKSCILSISLFLP